MDSVTRKWLDHAKKAGQTIDGSAADGSYAAGVNRISELLPILMNDIIQHAPVDQKVSTLRSRDCYAIPESLFLSPNVDYPSHSVYDE